jgi:hypothetical protein
VKAPSSEVKDAVNFGTKLKLVEALQSKLINADYSN